jgi:hypothetical protein
LDLGSIPAVGTYFLLPPLYYRSEQTEENVFQFSESEINGM